MFYEQFFFSHTVLFFQKQTCNSIHSDLEILPLTFSCISRQDMGKERAI